MDDARESDANDSAYQRLGGSAGIRSLTHRFYEIMESNPDVQHVRAMHPHDFSIGEDKLFKFLSGWFGGPDLYSREFEHPRLRMLHSRFPITRTESEHWLQCVNAALKEQVADLSLRSGVELAFVGMANHLINTDQN